MEKQSLAVPISIVIAGAFVAGAIFFTRQAPTTEAPRENTLAEVSIRPVDATDHILGTPDAKVVLIEYSDTECPFCKRFHTTMKNILADYGKDGTMAWVYRHFPLTTLHQKAQKESEALECAAELGGNTAFWKYTDTIYAITPSNDGLDPAELLKTAEAVGLNRVAFSACLESGRNKTRVEADMNDALNSGQRGTPFTVMQFKKEIPKIAINKIMSFNAGFPEQYISATKDNKTIVMSGALPEDLIRAIIQIGTGVEK